MNPPDWTVDALCIEIPGDIWFPNESERHLGIQAQRICRTCPVQNTCLQHALDHDIPHGIFGGLTAAERRRIRKEPA